VVPRAAVIEADALISFGLGGEWNFEEDVHRKALPLLPIVFTRGALL